MKLADYLASKQLKPASFAGIIGVPASTVSRWLKGERRPQLKSLAKIARETGDAVTANDFMPPVPAPSEAQGAA